MAQPVKDDLPAAPGDPGDWAEALQEGTLQGLAAARTLLAVAMRRGSHQALERAAGDAVRQIDHEIVALRALLAESRPDQASIRPRSIA